METQGARSGQLTASMVVGILGGVFGILGALVAILFSGLGFPAFGSMGLGYAAVYLGVLGIVGASLARSRPSVAARLQLIAGLAGFFAVSTMWLIGGPLLLGGAFLAGNGQPPESAASAEPSRPSEQEAIGATQGARSGKLTAALVLGIVGGVLGILGGLLLIVSGLDAVMYALGFAAFLLGVLGIVGGYLAPSRPSVGARLQLIAGLAGFVAVTNRWLFVGLLMLVGALLAWTDRPRESSTSAGGSDTPAIE